MAVSKVKGVIFGIGKYWNQIKPFLSEELEIVGYMDNNVKIGGGVFT